MPSALAVNYRAESKCFRFDHLRFFYDRLLTKDSVAIRQVTNETISVTDIEQTELPANLIIKSFFFFFKATPADCHLFS